jgi:DNA mismatch repair protein MutL
VAGPSLLLRGESVESTGIPQRNQYNESAMGQIKVLDQNMINMIAAGEVIERPASVVKELMENSIDSGATKIIVTIEDGGRKLMSVSDNGCGMDAEDLAKAFEPHTTSKIKTSKDLHNISTLGFRGEALASIASVAQVKAVSRPRAENRRQKTEDRRQPVRRSLGEDGRTEDRAPNVSEGINEGRETRDEGRGTRDAIRNTQYGANCIEIDCGNKSSVSPASADLGTTIQVRDIFYKLPARRKFLRAANTEMGHIAERFTRIALANNNLDMTLIHNGREVYRLASEQVHRQRITELFSSEISENLIETESNEKGIRIFALLGRPNISRMNNKFQYVFLNGRFIRDKFISHAIKEAYRGHLEPDRFPVAFVFVQMPYEDYDVNVHPTKIEVRFYNANLIHSQILGCLREKLLGTDLNIPAKLPTTAHTETEYGFRAGHRNQKITDAMTEFFRKHKPIETLQQAKFRQQFSGTVNDVSSEKSTQYAIRDTHYDIKFLQVHDSYIVEQTEDGFIIIDQHALHERILYERLHDRIQNSKLESQRLLVPESIEVTDAQVDVIKTNAELIEKLGIELVPFGPRVYAIQAFPTLLARAEIADFVRDLIDLLTDKGVSFDAERLLDEVLNMAACKAAIKAGQRLSDSEIAQLLADRQRVEYSDRCPHGRPTTIKFSLSDLEKQFKRT